MEETIEKLTNKIAKIIEGSKVIASKFKQENGNATNALKKWLMKLKELEKHGDCKSKRFISDAPEKD